jgi:hypothetical protein
MRTPRRLAVGVVALVAGLGAPPADAGSISINMTAVPEVREGGLDVALKVTNTGDEAASAVRPTLFLRSQLAYAAVRDALPPGGGFEETLRLPAAGLGPGRWPFRVAVDYTDANQYPFQALHVAVATSGDPPPAKVVVTAVDVPALSVSTEVTLRVKNLAGVARDATVSVFVPDGLEATDATQQLRLEPWAEKEARVPLVNRTALAGSRYPVFVAVEYDDDGVHQASTSHGMVDIQAKRALASRGLLWVVGALIAGWLLFLGWRAWRRQPA